MFHGANSLSVDAKGRFALPKSIRTRLEEAGSTDLVVTVGMWEKCLYIYRSTDWEAVQAQFDQMANADELVRHAQRKIVGHAAEVQLDASGRILLSGELREYARIDRKAKSLGMGHRLEVWDPEVYRLYDADVEARARGEKPQLQIPDVLKGLRI